MRTFKYSDSFLSYWVVKVSIEDTIGGMPSEDGSIDSRVSFLGNARKHLKEVWDSASERVHSYFDSYSPAHGRNKGLTLNELLVSISIMALLLGILIPVSRGVRDRAKATYCANNVRNLSIAWMAYKDDNNKIVGGFAGLKEHAPWVHAPIGRGDAIEKEKEGIRRGLLFPYVGKELKVYSCKSDGRRFSSNQAFRSYSIAGGMNGVSESGEEEIYPIERYNEIEMPAEKYVFVEAPDARGWNMGSWILHPKSGKWINPVAVWHDNASSLGYADGHVEMRKWKGKGFIQWCELACSNPGKFKFERVPAPDEMEEFNSMRRGYAYKALIK